ncbi:MAG TPA: site-2 protease family protein [Sedimentisphaerales bacterium]|nr:site-2 protease family protein [Sedimentisphaerales bacterium]
MSESESSLNENTFCEKSPGSGFGRRFSGVLLLIVIAAVISLLIRNLDVFGNILKVIIGFGGVILVHEFGHFVVAKLSGMKVEAFSIGFSPVLAGILRTERGYRIRILPSFFPKENDDSDEGRLSFTIGRKGKPGETEYRIGLIPFGGFNKILGQEDTKAAKAGDDPRSYINKPIIVRMAVIAAGVVFNALSAILVFMIVYLVGINLVPPVVGGVAPNSPAARAGLRAGDEIIEIAGKKDNLDFRNIIIAAILSGRDEKVPLRVRHTDNTEEDLAIAAKRMSTLNGEMRAFGIEWPTSLTIANVSDAAGLYKRTGLKPGDRIKSVNGKQVRAYWELEDIIAEAFVPAVTVVAERTDPVSKKSEAVESQLRLEWLYAGSLEVESDSELSHVYSMVPRLRVTDVSKEGDANDVAHALRRGDIILAVGNIENPTYKELRDLTEEYESKALPIKALRLDGGGAEEVLTVTVTPKWSRDVDRVVIGINVELDTEHPVVAKTITAEGGPAALAIPRGATITAVDGVSVSSFYDIVREIRRNSGQRITIDYRLSNEIAGDVVLQAGATEKPISVKVVFAEFVPFKLLQRLYKAGGPGEAITIGLKKTSVLIVDTCLSIRRMIQGLVSRKEFSGPVGLIKVSYDIAAERPLVEFIHFLGLISVLLAVFNLLPIPPFDGGWLVLLAVEKVRGSALSERAQGAVAYAGVVFVIALFLYLTFNDIVNIFSR